MQHIRDREEKNDLVFAVSFETMSLKFFSMDCGLLDVSSIDTSILTDLQSKKEQTEDTTFHDAALVWLRNPFSVI